MTTNPQNLLENDEIIINPGDYEDVSELQQDLDQELNAIFSEFGGDENIDEYEIRVYRVQPGKGALGYLFACVPTELPILDRLRDEYGGGDFEVRILKNKKIFRRRKTIVEPPVKAPEKPHNATSELMMLVNTMNNGFNKLGEMMIQQQPQNNNMGEMLQNMVLMKEILATNNTPAESPIKMMSQLVDIQKSLVPADGGGGAGTGDLLLNMANTVLPKLAEMGEQEQKLKTLAIKRKMMNGKRRPQKRPQQIEGNNPMKMHLIFLCAQAKADRDPITYAQMVIENTAPEKMDELKEFIAGPKAIDEMTKVHKAVGLYPVWFRDLGECILELLNEGKPDETLTNPPVSTINPVSSTIPGATGSQTIAPIREETNADDDAVISDT